MTGRIDGLRRIVITWSDEYLICPKQSLAPLSRISTDLLA